MEGRRPHHPLSCAFSYLELLPDIDLKAKAVLWCGMANSTFFNSIAVLRKAPSRGVFVCGVCAAGVLFFTLLTGCKPAVQRGASVLPFFSPHEATNAYHHTERLVALGPRAAGTPGAQRAAEHLKSALQEIGIDAARIDAFEDEPPAGVLTFYNVLAELPAAQPEAPRIVLLSHFDTKINVPGDSAELPFEGANDSGSSTGLLLALAQSFAAAPQSLPCPILFAFLDGEECAYAYSDRDGLHGSKHLARDLRQRGVPVRAVILADMIGDRDLVLQIPRNSTPELRLLALTCAEQLGITAHVTLINSAILDDHQPFLNAGFPAINLIDFNFGSAPGFNDYWHTMEDTMDKLAPRSFEITGSLIVSMINTLCQPQ